MYKNNPLSYRYNGNQLVNVSDSATDEPTYNGAFNFSDGSDETDEYAYDDNGNMIRDDNKDISAISYNPIGQPSQIKFKSVNKRICYDYDATGVKLRVRHVSPISAMASDVTFHMDRFDTAQQSIASLIEVEEAPSVRASLTDLMQGLAVSNNMTIASDISGTSKTSSKTTSKSSTSSTLPKVQVSPAFELSEHDEHVTDYCGNLIYEDGVLSKILFDGGCITLEDGSPVYHVYFRDHLGSVRVVCDRNGNAEQVNHYYPYGGLIGDLSTDDNKQKFRYKYNGKEFDRMHGLDTYDYGARQYDPARITWDRIDQLCEKKPWNNPYIFCSANPINRIDLDGMDDYFSNEGKFLYSTPNGRNILIQNEDNTFANIADNNFQNNQNSLQQIVTHYMSQIDKNDFKMYVVGPDANNPQSAAMAYAKGTSNYYIMMNTDGKINAEYGNIDNLLNSCYHESVHRYGKSSGNINEDELNTILQQSQHESWSKVTNSFASTQALYAITNLNSLKNSQIVKQYIPKFNDAFIGIAIFSFNEESGEAEVTKCLPVVRISVTNKKQ